jgi:hypothetical protein
MSCAFAPADAYFEPHLFPLVEATALTSASTNALGSPGSSRSAASRPSVSVEQILQSVSLSKQPFPGKRHPWNMLVGTIAPETLQWLRADSFFEQGSDARGDMTLAFAGSTARSKTEEGRKLIIAGRMGKCATSGMCGLSLQKPLPSRRVVAWHQAFMACNMESLMSLQGCARAMVSKLGPDNLSANGEHFMATPLEEWFVTCGELCFTKGGSSSDGFWEEPKHQDGGMSVLHLGLTLAGNRTLRCWQTENLPDIVLHNAPGTVYLGQLTGCEHQVTHEASEPWELLEVAGLGSCSCTVMCRTALFPHYRARGRNTTPNPLGVFLALARAFASSLRHYKFSLPSLEACEEMEATLLVELPAPARPMKKSKTTV